MRAEQVAMMPTWPARMGEEMAARYLGVCRTTFHAGVSDGRYPAPVREGRRTFWSKQQLDDFVTFQFQYQKRKNSWD